MNEHFAADVVVIAATTRVIECDARHNIRPGQRDGREVGSETSS